MQTSETGRKLIQHFESCKLKAYADDHSPPIATIGWGNTTYPNGAKVQMGEAITQQQADDMFAATLPRYEAKVSTRITRELLQHEFDALVSFCYNAGTGYRGSNGKYHDFDLWQKVNQMDADILSYWQKLATTAGGKPLSGLIRRRKSESTLFTTGELNFFSIT